VCGNFAALFDPSGASGEFCDFPFAGTTGLNGSDFANVRSIYGSLGFDFTNRLTLDVEGRYQEDERSEGISNFSKTFRDLIPRITLSYDLSDDVMVYGLATQGVLPGVVNAPILNCQDITYSVPFISPITGQPSTSSECEQYREQLGNNAREVTEGQKLDALEVGIKGVWGGGRVQANLAVYYQEWVNSPSFFAASVVRDDNGDGIPNPFPNGVPIGVPGRADYQGIELESTFLPTENWLIDVNVSYNSSEFADLFLPVGGQADILGTTNIKGNQAGRFPEWSGNVSSTYSRRMSNGFDWFTRWDLNYMGKAPAGLTNLAFLKSYYLVNARLGVEKEDMRFEIYVKNLFDEDSWSTGQEFPDFTLFGNGFDFSHMGLILIPQDKRTLGMRASYSF
jgi:iron complex outermembrane receptor protein